jgi:phospholipid-binding lipoprotein MlaA
MTAAERDPWENFNRSVYRFNSGFDRVLGKPVVTVYRAVVPVAGRRGITNFFSNVGEPTNGANALLQGKVKSFFRAFDRFLINGVLGVGGLADHATDLGLPAERHDFGQTLAVYGVKSGPYLVAPFFGPGTLRDQAGFGVDFLADPSDIGFRELLSRQERYIKLGTRVVNIRNRISDSGGESLLTGSADEYATVRSAWLQLRRNELYDGAAPDLYEEDLPAEEAVGNTPAPATLDRAPANTPPAPAAAPATTPAPTTQP